MLALTAEKDLWRERAYGASGALAGLIPAVEGCEACPAGEALAEARRELASLGIVQGDLGRKHAALG